MSTPSLLLHNNPNMVEVLEKDLIDKTTAIAASANIDIGIAGVFSLDDLEAMTVNDLCRKLACGISYLGAEDHAPAAVTTNTNSARMSDFNFIVVVAVPVTKAGSENRLDGSKMLSVLRQQLQGTKVVDSKAEVRWFFVKETPQPSESNNTILYYSQVWRIVLPIATPKSQS